MGQLKEYDLPAPTASFKRLYERVEARIEKGEITWKQGMAAVAILALVTESRRAPNDAEIAKAFLVAGEKPR